MRLLSILAAGCFVSSMSMRVIDPVVPDVAREFAISAGAAALLASAFSLPYALGQPLLGALGDAVGKARVIKATLAIIALCLALAALAPTVETLFAARVVGGAVGGGVIPLAFAIVGDRFAYADRQLALSRLLTAVIAGQMAGAIGAGLIASSSNWRYAVGAGAVLAAAALLVTIIGLAPRPVSERRPFGVQGMRDGYALVFANPRALICFAAVFVEGIAVFGLFPYLAVLLEERQAGGVKEAGFVLAAFGVGGLAYTAVVRTLLPVIGSPGLMRLGGALCGAALASSSFAHGWRVEAAAFVAVGLGFYMIHNSLQTEATELAPGARASGVAAHAFSFFLGQAFGPIIYAVAFRNVESDAALWAAGAAMAATGLIAAALLARTPARLT